MTRTVADVVALELRRAGVRAIFGVPGGAGNLDLVDAAGRAGLPFVLTATETAGAIAGLAQAEVTGSPGACLTTLGPGAASVANGVATAWLDRAPILVFTDCHASAGRAAYLHQHLDHPALFSGITKATVRLTGTDDAAVVARALHAAENGRPGPVHVDCPGDVLSSVAQVHVPGTVGEIGSLDLPPSVAGARSVVSLECASLLARAKKPLLLVGLGARRPDDVRAIRALCHDYRVPALVTYKAKGVVSDSDPWFAGVFTSAAIERPLIDESDLLIAVGLDTVELLPRPWKSAAPVVGFGRWLCTDDHVPFRAQVVSEIPRAIEELRTHLRPSDWSSLRVRSVVESQQVAVDVPAPGLTAQRAVQILAARSAPTHRVTVDAGAHMFAATMFWPVRDAGDMLISNGLSTMAFALPAAIGAAVADRTRPVVALIGDGGLLMCAGELLTVARERLPVIVVVFNDESLSLIEIKQQQRQLKPAGVALGPVRWAAVAEGMGVRGLVATNEAELARAIDAAASANAPALIDVQIDRSNYLATMRAVRGQ